MRKRGFTLLELMVVVAMIMIIIGAFVTAVGKARTRAKIAKAMQETRELTNAVLAYEQYARGRSLKDEVTDWTPCTKGSLAMVLGGKTGDNDMEVPVLFNASLTRNELRDPWGHAYQLKIQQTEKMEGGGNDEMRNEADFQTAVMLPNFWRLTDKEGGREL